MKRDDIPFQRHLVYYVIVKYAVIAAAVLIAAFIAFRAYSG